MKTLVEVSSLFHESDSRFSYPLDGHTACIALLTKKGDPHIKRVSLLYQGKFRGPKSRIKVEMPLLYSTTLHDHYEVTLHLEDVRIIYVFEIEDTEGNLFYYSEAGVSSSFNMGETCFNVFQLPHINSSDVIYTNKKFADRVFYQIFPDRFARDESVNHSKTLINWGDKVTMMNFAGGNLKGISSKLDYLKDLGIGAIYLNPVWKGSTNHKYDTLVYGEVDPDFGTDEDLVELVEKCHKEDILVVLDIVYNHMSYLNPIFQDVVKKGRESAYYDWFIIDGDYPSFEKGNYLSFGIHPYMPKINLSNKECAAHFVKVSLDIVKKYHVDGFRLDVGDEVPHTFWRELSIALKEYDEDFLLIGEDWHNAESFLNAGDQFGSVMNYAITRLAEEFFAEKKYGASQMVSEVYGVWDRYKKPINHNLLNLIDSHDKKRFIHECHNDLDVYLSAYLFLLMFPGLPSLYYGDEIAMEGEDAIDCRRCFPWDDMNEEVLDYFKKMISIRNSFPLSEAKMTVTSLGELFLIHHDKDGESLSIYWNTSDLEISLVEEGGILSLNYENGILKPNGFLVIKK